MWWWRRNHFGIPGAGGLSNMTAGHLNSVFVNGGNPVVLDNTMVAFYRWRRWRYFGYSGAPDELSSGAGGNGLAGISGTSTWYGGGGGGSFHGTQTFQGTSFWNTVE